MKLPAGIFCLLLILLLFPAGSCLAQELPTDPDSLGSVRSRNIPTAEKNADFKGLSRPGRAALYSALVPGLGQAYNKKYWKLPIVYGGLGALGYLVVTNHQDYTEFRDAFLARGSSDTLSAFDTDRTRRYTRSQLRVIRDGYRRNRDMSIIVTIVVYGLNIVDAYVDAHFLDYDLSDDLSLRVSPNVMRVQATAYQAPGVSLTFSLNSK